MDNNNIFEHFAFSPHNNEPLLYLSDGAVLTYAAIDKRVSKYCNYFSNLGLNPKDRIVVQADKSVDALCIYLASLKYGAIYIPLNPAFKADELEYFIEDTELSLFVCTPEQENTILNIRKQKNLAFHIEVLDAVGNFPTSINCKISDLPYQFNTYSIASKDDIACILYTSGTTGKPKGAMLSHNNLLTNALELINIWGINKQDKLLHMLPIFHCHGLFFACHSILLSGAGMLFLPKFDVDSAIKYLPQSTIFMGVPTYYTRLLADKNFDKSITNNIRLFISGSAPLLENTFNEFNARTGHTILERYGMTETGINTSNPLQGYRLVSSVGIPLPAVKLRIVDDNNNEVKDDQPGHIQVKGPNVFIGYWKKEDKTKEAFTVDGYFKTGDIGKLNKDGYLYIIGRDKDMIISGGLNVYPKEIEDLLDAIPGIQESAVIGVTDKDFGEAVTAVMVINAANINENNIIEILKAKLANYKVPKRVIVVDTLPRNAMGKVQKNILRENYRQNFL